MLQQTLALFGCLHIDSYFAPFMLPWATRLVLPLHPPPQIHVEEFHKRLKYG